MNKIDITDKLKDIFNENHIWIIYLIIIIASWYSNSLETNYFINGDTESKDKYRYLLIKIFFILTIVYGYFFKSSLEDVKALKPTDSSKKIKLTNLSLLGSLLIVISGFIFLYIAYMDQDIDVEIAFN